MGREAMAESLQTLLLRAQAERRLVSVSAALLRDGQVAWTGAAGLAGAESRRPATPDTRYRIGSITKSFTAAAVMRMRDHGRLDLDDALARHLPEYEGAGVTLRRLLGHLSGMQREPAGHVWEAYEFPDLAGLATTGSVLPPGLGFHYSNVAFALLGEVVGRLAGKPFREHLQETFLTPLGLHETTWDRPPEAAGGYFVHPHAGTVREMPAVDIGDMAAAGQLWSTPADLVRWGGFLIRPDPAVLAPASAEEMRGVQVMVDPDTWQGGYGLGLVLTRLGDRVFAGHDGAMPGFTASLIFSPLERLAAAVCANVEGGPLDLPGLAADMISRAAENWPVAPAPWVPSSEAPAGISELLGSWWSEGTEHVFAFREGRLEVTVPARPRLLPSVFEPDGPGAFRTVRGRERGERLEVVRDASGSVSKLYWATYPFTREPSA